MPRARVGSRRRREAAFACRTRLLTGRERVVLQEKLEEEPELRREPEECCAMRDEERFKSAGSCRSTRNRRTENRFGCSVLEVTRHLRGRILVE